MVSMLLGGNPLAGAVGGGDEDKGPSEEDQEAAAELAEQRRKEEEKRAEKHRQMEAEREQMRQGIREKYNIKKKEDFPLEPAPGGVGRSRGPGEPVPLPGMGGQDDESMVPKDLDDLKNKMSGLGSSIGDKVADVGEKCSIQ